MTNKPLDGVRVLDLTHMLSGPYGAMILADLGCDIIKVEPPVSGEGTRRLLENDPDYSHNGVGAYFYTLNRNKRSTAIDLKSEKGLEVFYDLVKVSDVVISNFSAGVTAKLKIDYAALSKINPKIITCCISGFGEDGPNFQRPAFDQIAQALGGGMFAVMGIQAALIARTRSGEGQHVDISMLDCQISLLNYMATMYTMSGIIPEPIGNSHFVHVPYNTFTTSDYPIVIAAVGDQFWPRMLNIFKHPDLLEEKYTKAFNRQKDKEKIEAILQDELNHHNSEHWLKLLESEKIPCARVNNFEQALSDEQIQYRNMVVEVPHPNGGSAKVPGNPIKLSKNNEESFTHPPLLGEHTYEVLDKLLGYSVENIQTLKENGIIGLHDE